MKVVFCKICNKETKYTRRTFAKYHLRKEHNISSKEYYDKFKIDNGEGSCKICGKSTFFKNIEEGYNVFCSNACSHLDEDVIKKKMDSRSFNEREKYDGKLFLQTDECIDKIKKTKKQRYGDENYCNSDKIKKTIFDKYGGYDYQQRQTKRAVLEEYGVDNFFKTEQFREAMEDEGKWVSLDLLSKFEKYRREVNKETRKWREELFLKWDGRDFYNGDKLITYKEWKRINPEIHVSNNKLQPTVDHKVSIVYGFNNSIDAKVIGNIDNLCICSRDTNVRKNYKTNRQYKRR